MVTFFRYLFEQVQTKKLSRVDALAILKQYYVGANRRQNNLHPLLHRNSSDLTEQRFSSTLSGEEFYLSDHVVGGRKVFPGVCYLEMARAAIEQSAGTSAGLNRHVVLKNVVWLRPMIVEEALEIHIGLYPHENGEIEFEIYSTGVAALNLEKAVVYAQGSALIGDAIQVEMEASIDLSALRSLSPRSVDVARCYAAFDATTLTYGPAHQGLTSVQMGKDGAGQPFVLAQVTLPACVSETREQYVLHPSLLDSALQASIGFALDSINNPSYESTNKPMLPFALERLEIMCRLPAQAWVVIRLSSLPGSSGLQKLDLDICDEEGRVCARLKGFSSRLLDQLIVHPQEKSVKLLLEREWVAKPAPGKRSSLVAGHGERVVLLASIYKERVTELAGMCSGVQVEVLDLQLGNPMEEFGALALSVFGRVQSILQAKPKHEVLLQVVLEVDAEHGHVTGAFSGLLKSASQENPKFVGQVITVAPTARVADIAQVIADNASELARRDVEIRYVDGVRKVVHFRELTTFVKNVGTLSPWKNDGVYLITGGAGGLGLIFAREIASKASGAKIILTGRSELGPEKLKQIETLHEHGSARVEYRLLDVNDAIAVTRCVHALLEQYGALNGVIHSAGIVSDSFVIKKTAEEFSAVMAPKVAGTLNLDRATQNVALDFMIFFSSASGTFGNVGQSDYALANGFMDDYAVYRTELVKDGKRQGRTLSISWPLWTSGGMRMDAATQDAALTKGFDTIDNSEGVDALYQTWLSDEPQIVVLSGSRHKLMTSVGLVPRNINQPVVSAEPTSTVVAPLVNLSASGAELRERTIQYLKRLLSSALKLSAERIETSAALEKYGIDSILALKLVNELEGPFGSLPKTLMFEYQSVQALAEYFIENHLNALHAILNLRERIGTPLDRPANAMEKIEISGKRRRERFPMRAHREQRGDDPQATEAFDIAIVGLSGRYPLARDVQAYWENLKAGKDCITEIPPERWDYQKYFDPQKGTVGKSYSKWGGFIEGVREFDPLFFSISPREAIVVDPQERLFLQCVYQTLEDAGYTRDELKLPRGARLDSSVGVFVGVMYEEYQLYGAQAQTSGYPFALSGSPASIANRVSYFCDFHGPSMAVDTMCSSSLTAIHLACHSIRSGDCQMAIAGGVNVSIHPNKYLLLAQGNFASSAGRCESFGRGGDGYVPGEGVGSVLLRPLAKAIEDGDHIYGVIKGTSINHGGKTNGYTVPNPRAHAQVVANALRVAKINPRTVSYIEAHGTGTVLGDPIEIAGLTQAFASHTSDKGYCAIGSAKSNIGHLESAAGIAGLTKVLLQMQHQTLVPSLHSQVLNPHIDFARTPFRVQQGLEKWLRPVIHINGQTKEYPRIAGISSFGAGGSNAHLIVEEYVEPAALGAHVIGITLDNPALIILSAKTVESLKERVQQLLVHIQLRQYTDLDLGNLAYTLQVGREMMEHRLACIATSIVEVQDKLNGYVNETERAGELSDFYQGEVKRSEIFSELSDDTEFAETLAKWISSGKYRKVLELWVKGFTVAWTKLYDKDSVYGRTKPKRISLPTYAFSRDQYWVADLRPKLDDVARENPVVQPAMDLTTAISVAPLKVIANTSTKPQRIALRSLNMASVVVEHAMSESYKRTKLERVEKVFAIAHTDEKVEETRFDVRVRETASSPDVLRSERVSAKRLEDELRLSLATALYMESDKIAVDRPFVELGLDSIIGVEWTRTISRHYGAVLNATKLYEHPTIRTLAAWMQTTMPSAGLHALEHLPAEVNSSAEQTDHELQDFVGNTHKQSEVLSLPLVDASITSRDALWKEGEGAKTVARDGATPYCEDGIAIVGMSGRYPGINNVAAYWESLADGRNLVKEIPKTRWDANFYYDPIPGRPGKTYSKWLGCLEDVECFDPLFFNISPAEAHAMDPQQRLFLEEGYKAFQDAGYSSARLSNSNCGVYLGVASGEYGMLLLQNTRGIGDATGNSTAIAAARIAYYLNLKGPAIPIDTACSSSLVATHLACQALRSREIEMALVGGVSLYLTPESFIGMCAAGMLSPDGKCKTFDNEANGFVPGEAVAALVLKRLSDAEADEDRIYGVIIASGINQDGRTNGITAPSVSSQIELFRDIYSRHQINPGSISYVEMHGTGTKLGDPIELEALATVFKEKTPIRNFCAIGSVKSNIGHTTAAAGIASVQKVLLCMQHQELVPTLNFVTPNEHFDFPNSPFVVNTERRPWDTMDGQKRRAAVSSFGYSGTNAHIVIEEYCAPKQDVSLPTSKFDIPALLVLSAKNEARLGEQVQRLCDYLDAIDNVDFDLLSVAYTLQLGRDAMEQRLALVANNKQEVIEGLRDFLNGKHRENVCIGQINKDNLNALILDDDDVGALVETWIRSGKLRAIAEVWVRGAAIDWRRLYSTVKPKRMNLPTYPFAKEHYWLGKNSISGPLNAHLEEAAPKDVEPRAQFIAPSSANVARLEEIVDGLGAESTTGTLDYYVRNGILAGLSASLRLDIGLIELDQPFVDYGLDSIKGIRTIEVINETLSIDLRVTSLFDYPTVDKLVRYVAQNFQAKLAADLSHRSRPSLVENFRSSRELSEAGEQFLPKLTGAVASVESLAGKFDQSIQHRERVAIIGISGRYPQSHSVEELWENLAKGRELLEEVSRWDLGQNNSSESTRPCIRGGFLSDIEKFDPLFFNISGTEATYMDPQQRLFMEEAWKSLEDAGYAGSSVEGRLCGVYVGCAGSDYAGLFGSDVPAQAMWGNTSSIIPARISYYLNLKGPAVTVDTACSSSMVAMHLACQGLWSGETELALAGGVSIQCTEDFYSKAIKASMLSPSGKCHAFDDRADGFVAGEAVAVVVLKRLSDALRDGDHIYGVVRGSGINQDGSTNGITAPSALSQEQLQRNVFESFHIHPEELQFVEAHGTGTKLGDPVELHALTQSFRRSTDKKNFCAIGSIKTNVGHTMAVAGVTGVIKVLLALKHKQIPPSLNYVKGNSHIDFENSPFFVNTSLRKWEADAGTKRCAAVNSFGISGTNAHCVIEEAPAVERTHKRLPGYLVVLSARTKVQLKEQAERLLLHCEEAEAIDCGNISYTLVLGRKHLNHRLACIVASKEALTEALRDWVANKNVARVLVADLNEKNVSEQASIRKYGNRCIDECGRIDLAPDYLERLSTVAELYVQGYKLSFDRLFSGGQFSRISLPTYPFAREHYWVKAKLPTARGSSLAAAPADECNADSIDSAENKIKGVVGALAVRSSPVEPIERLLFCEEWQSKEVESYDASCKVRTIVVLLSDVRHQAELLSTLAQMEVLSSIVFIVRAGGTGIESVNTSSVESTFNAEFAASLDSRRHYQVIGEGQEFYTNTLRGIVEDHGSIDVVWCLWGIEDASSIVDQKPIVHLLRGLAAAGVKEAKVLLAGEHQSALEHSYLDSWIGYGRSINRILPNMQVSTIREERKGTEFGEQHVNLTRGIDKWTRRLWRETQAKRIEDAFYKEEIRHILAIKPLELLRDSKTNALRKGGVYLITGGLGGLGYLLATHLAKSYSARLILIGRSLLDEKKEAKLADLVGLGGQAMYVAADACNLDQLRAAFEKGHQCFGELHGVLHVAGIESSATFLTKDERSIEAVLAPKITGTLVLHEVIKDQILDFICYFSSTAAVLGDFGSCDYSVGNRFELAHAKYSKKKALAICWPLWADGSMGSKDLAATQLYLKASGQRALQRDEGFELFEQLLASHIATDLNHAIAILGKHSHVYRMLGLTRSVVIEKSQVIARREHRRRPELQGLTQSQSVLRELQEMASELLMLPLERLDARENLAEFGFDSIGLAGFAQRLAIHFRVEVLPSVFFSHTTLGKLADYFITDHALAMQSHYGDYDAPKTEKSAGVGLQIDAAHTPSRGTRREVPALLSSIVDGDGREISEAIALVGMSGRFPGARSVEELWQVLAQGREAVQEIPLMRFDWSGYYQEDATDHSSRSTQAGKTNSKWLGALPGVEEFDPRFFEISPREAELMDPRQRLLLQESFKALEDAGYGSTQLTRHKIGMFVGVEQGDYQWLAGGEGNITANHDAILAARLSYFLNLRGPAMAINTACSSGLVAAHQACQSLRSRECDTAIAAGVNLILTPQMYVGMSQAGMLSGDGKCYAFDRRANGMVPGEAVVAVVFKRLSQAEEDKDLIYAVVRGSGINYDGKTNGLTAPSGAAQTELIRDVYTRARIKPSEIEYIVTHGTGTRLGDPIEINALREAFKESEQTAPYCALTSTKTNLGHTFAASGLVSLVSLVQALRHETIPASLHCEQLSDYIDWRRSPFYVNTQNKAWPKRQGKARLGAVSAFGMSGTNAHMVVEGYDQEVPANALETVPGCYLLALSAKTDEALQQRIFDLTIVLKDELRSWDGDQLAALSHTLLAHRQHFNHRCVVVVEDGKQAIALLESIGAGEKLPMVLRGSVGRDFVARPAFKRYAEDLLDRLSLQLDGGDPQTYRESILALGDLYCQGYFLNWKLLYGDCPPQRLPLPTYPFAKERYWIESNKQGFSQSSMAVLHPLLQRNTSSLEEQRFSSTFRGDEFYLSDHVVKGRKVLPGVCYLEMARAAVECSSGFEVGVSMRVELRDVIWSRPVVVTGSKDVHIGLYSNERGEIEFEIYSAVAEMEKGAKDACGEVKEEDEFIHSQGRAVLLEVTAEVERIDVDALRSRCDQEVDVSACYAAFSAMGIEYGAAHRGLVSMQVGKDKDGQPIALAHLHLPSSVSVTAEHYVLHPSVMDSALQASLGLSFINMDATLASNKLIRPSLPFALDRLEIIDRSPVDAWAVVRPRAGVGVNQSSIGGVHKLDIDICDESGRLCVRLKGFTSRVLAGELQSATSLVASETQVEQLEDEAKAIEALTGAVLLVPRWEATVPQTNTMWPAAESRVLLMGGTEAQHRVWRERYPQLHLLSMDAALSVEVIAEFVQALGDIDHVVWLSPAGQLGSPTDERLIKAQALRVIGLYRSIKALLSLDYGVRALGLSVVTWQTQAISCSERTDPAYASVHGLIGSLAKEYANWQVRLVDLPIESDDAQAQSLLEEVLRLPADPQGNAWVYRAEEWYRQQLIPCVFQQSPEPQYRTGGLYVVIGGAGGIGEAFSEYLIKKYQARMIWIGRRELDAVIQAKIDSLSAWGPAPVYLCADATNREALEHAYQTIRSQHGGIHGVVHAAIELLDKSLAQMDEARFKASLAAKVDVSVRMAQVFAGEPLDWVLFFSSLQSFAKAAGQSNYAAGCTFKDAFAHELGHAWPCPVRVMSWGYWGSVGIVASGDYRARMAQYGINSIEPAEGMVALENLLSGPASQLVFLKTARPQALTGLAEVHERITLAGEHAPSLLTSLSQSTARIFAQEHTDARIAVAQNDFQQLLGRVLFSQLQSLGLFTEVNASIVMWQQQVNLSATYSRWLKESIRILESAGYITVKDDICTVKHPGLLDAAAVWAEWDERTREWLKDPSLSAQVKIAAATMRALPEILTGKRLATDILFPNSSMALVQEIYKNNALADYFNAVLADTVVEYVAQRCKQNPATRLRILEIGAGTGGTSECVLRQLKPYQQSIAEYCYTDISKAFLMHAEQAYGPTTPYLTYKLFNVEQSLKLQGIENGTYDVVIATNVLHATKNIRYTLRNAKAALKRHGMLVLNEISGRSLFAHLTFGLLEGWWLYEDSTVRIPGTPAVSAKTWQRLLEGEGFQSIAFPANAFHEHGQQIIVTESDGVIRQQVQARNSDRVAVRRAGVFQDKGAQSEQKQAKRSAVVIAKNTVTAVRSDEFRHSNENATLRERAITALKKLVGQTFKVPMQHLDENESLEKYGIDSILVVNLANGLKRFFPDLSSTLFFEHQTIAALVAHFIQTERAAVGRWVGLKDPAGSVSSNEVESSHDQREADASETTSARLTLPMRRRGRRALLSVQTEARAESIESSVASAQDIAIIGLSGRYPQAKNVQEFWENLKAGKNCISEIPQARWDHRRYFDAEKGKPGKSYSKWGGFIADVDQFDPLFFRISPKEAEQMDPQERLFLQEAYASIEDAGYTPATLCVSKKVGVYVGVMNSTYFKQSNYWSIANRVSYLCDFQGPSMAVDTACSSSLTAIHLAIESIYSGTCECAIAGGVNLIIDPIQYTNLSAMMMLSSDGRCKAFGDQADGFVDGEGVGAVVLKPIEKAILAGDHIYGVIKSSTVNAGGKTNGYTVPNPIAQRELIQAALSKANVDPRTVSYIEAHGTGTELGDPIEISGLSKAFQVGTQDKQFCAIGSAKSNIGHCESAAGIAGLTKVLLQLKYRTLVPSLHSQVLNPHIDFANSPFVVQRELGEWKRPVLGEGAQRKEYPRIAGISAFGAGGSNAHVVIEEYVDQRGVVAGAVVSANRPAIIVLSAKDEARLKERVEQLLSALGGGEYGEGDLAAIAYTLQLGREAMEQRLALSVVSLSELREKLQRWISGEEGIEELYRGEVKSNKETLVLFTADEDLQKAIGAWIEKGKYSKLLDLWVKGLVFDWHSVHGENKPRRIPLPTYPFAKERHWAEVFSFDTSDFYLNQKNYESEPHAHAERTRLKDLISAVARDELDVKAATLTAKKIIN